MQFAHARRKNNGIQPLTDATQRPKAPLAIFFAGVFIDHRCGPVELLHQSESQPALLDIALVFDGVKAQLHFIYCMHIKLIVKHRLAV